MLTPWNNAYNALHMWGEIPFHPGMRTRPKGTNQTVGLVARASSPTRSTAPIDRFLAQCESLSYPGDLTDDDWAYVAPLIPPPKPGGGKRRTDMRAVMNGVMYILSTGCQWRYLPKDFPPYSTVHHYFIWWQCDRVLDRIHHMLYVACREKAEREASPTAAIIDSQSVKNAV